jgi:glycosyltransferase involved in cell wall biosynthesis
VFHRLPFRGISPLLQLFSPKFLHKLFIKETYDVEIGYREGCPNRIISGCSNKATKTFGWIHISIEKESKAVQGFRSLNEMRKCHKRLLKTAAVSEYAASTFKHWFNDDIVVSAVNNVVENDEILNKSKKPIDFELSHNVINICSVGRLTAQKSYDRLFNALASINQQGISNWHFYLLGKGELRSQLVELANTLGISDKITFLGYDLNPYKYVAKMDLFVCSSLYEGYSTAVTESIIVGTPVLTTKCSGMDEIFGDTKAGVIVDNSTEALTNGLREILSDSNILTEMRLEANSRSKYFSKENTIKQFENFIEE